MTKKQVEVDPGPPGQIIIALEDKPRGSSWSLLTIDRGAGNQQLNTSHSPLTPPHLSLQVWIILALTGPLRFKRSPQHLQQFNAVQSDDWCPHWWSSIWSNLQNLTAGSIGSHAALRFSQTLCCLFSSFHRIRLPIKLQVVNQDNQPKASEMAKNSKFSVLGTFCRQGKWLKMMGFGHFQP